MKLSSLKKIRPSKTWVILGIALAIGLLAALAARSYLAHQMQEIEQRAKGKMVNVVVAKGDIQKGSKLSSLNLAVRPIPVEFAHSVAISPESFDRVDGQVLAYDVKSGEMILWGLLETKKVPTFSARVESGHRAMTVPVDEINSISGMLEPGDTIDLMVSLDRKGKKLIFPLLQSVPVMATGQRNVDDPKSGEQKMYSTVTLNITPEEAKNVIVAREAGKLTALLRNPQDKQAINSGGLDVARALGLKGGEVGAFGDREVPVLYGGNGGKLPAEGMKLGDYVQAAQEQTRGNMPNARINNMPAPMKTTWPAPRS
jgi:pilus assembly protein CpaB